MASVAPPAAAAPVGQGPTTAAASADASEEEPPAVLAQPGEPAAVDTDAAGVPSAADDFTFHHYAPAQLAATLQDGSAVADASAALQGKSDSGRNVIYVATGGSDNNSGTLRSPFRSIARAARSARPGTKVLVAPGIYSGGFRTSVGGTPGARIAFISTTRWGARIVPPANSPNKTGWDNRGDHIDIIGFQLDGGNYQGGTRWTHGIYSGGSHVAVRHNYVHHIAQAIGCTRAGGAAIGVDSYYGGVKADVISNLVHDIGPSGCRYVQGIYVSTSGRVKNNVVYRVGEGGIHLWHDAHDVIITNNTVSGANTGIIIGGGNFYRSSKGADDVLVFSNIVYDNVMGISEQGKTGRNNTYRNNLVYQNSRYNWKLNHGLTHSGTVSEPPKFMASARNSKPNLKLDASSPAIGRATSSHAEEIDFEGKPRNATAGYDIGAYQHR